MAILKNTSDISPFASEATSQVCLPPNPLRTAGLGWAWHCAFLLGLWSPAAPCHSLPCRSFLLGLGFGSADQEPLTFRCPTYDDAVHSPSHTRFFSPKGEGAGWRGGWRADWPDQTPLTGRHLSDLSTYDDSTTPLRHPPPYTPLHQGGGC